MVPAPVKVSGLYRNVYRYDPRKRVRLGIFYDAFESFIRDLATGKDFTDEELEKTPYFDYLYNIAFDPNAGRPRKKYILNIIKNGIALFKSIKKEGIKNPVTMWKINGRYVLFRGYRRIIIAHVLGIREVTWIPEPR